MARSDHDPSAAEPGVPSERAVRAAVARAALGDGGGPGDVTVLETHISRVLLAGERAFKLKKPVELAFVDYSTPERRLEMCREEVRLNRRLAPDVYLGVRSLARRDGDGDGDAGELELAGEDDRDAVDYAVEMRRFDEDRSLRALLQHGELDEHHVEAIAAVLARFHAGVPAVDVDGAPALAVERRMTQNVHELLAIVDRREEVERLIALQRAVHAFVAARAAMLEERARHGRVREGHGDLRADHVLLEDGGGVAIVDCVEFDPGLRELDVADDLAFLVMDLTARGGARWADALVRAYRDAGGDPGDDALIAFYAAYRALVRAKVALLRADQAPAAGAEREGARADARELLALAERFAWRARLPLAIVVCGLPASGKSHLAGALAELSGLERLGSDEARKRLLGLKPGERAPAGAYGEELNRRTYAELGRLAADEVRQRGGVLVDATFRHRADRDAFAGSFDGAAPLLLVECVAPPEVLVRRAAAREADPDRVSDADRAVVERELGSWEAPHEVGPDAHVTLRTDRPVASAVADLLALLDERLGRLGAP